MRLAVTRGVSAALGRCELRFLPRAPIDVDLAVRQHREYERLLGELGCAVVPIPGDPALPDSVFVEDTALVLDEVAILLRPGAPSRRPEVAAVADALAPYRPLLTLPAPGTMDGGDVLRLGRTLYVGRSERTDASGAAALADAVAPHGYRVETVPVSGCLHLKSAVTAVAPDLLLVNPAWVGPSRFGAVAAVEVDAAEPHGANALRVGEHVVYPSAFPRTRERLERAGLAVRTVDVSELQKAEGAVTCCSLIFDVAAR